jgi:glycosyltransferase involved in cell wall biosynthesis
MKIGIDISQVVYEGTGVSRFTKGLINAILKYDRNNKWVFFFSSLRRNLQTEIKDKISNKHYVLIERKFPPKLLTSLLIKVGFNVESIDKSLDWFITSDWTEIPSKHTKKATIVHDLVYLRFPSLVEKTIRNTQIDRLNRVKNESFLIFADSDSTKKDLVEFLKIEKGKIILNYPGVDVKRPPNKTIKETLSKYRLDKQFILTVGKIEPRKNLKRLIESYKALNNPNVDLAVAGPAGWGDTPMNRFIGDGNIRFLGYVTDKELYSLYTSCLFFVYPSIWEGFGYPVVEAMKLGVPVATSNTSSLMEIAKDAALLFNPFNVEEIKNALLQLINNVNLRKDLAIKGKMRCGVFSWKNYYEKMINVLKNCS